eukprot:2310823-Rhodomonas_salina.2
MCGCVCGGGGQDKGDTLLMLAALNKHEAVAATPSGWWQGRMRRHGTRQGGAHRIALRAVRGSRGAGTHAAGGGARLGGGARGGEAAQGQGRRPRASRWDSRPGLPRCFRSQHRRPPADRHLLH